MSESKMVTEREAVIRERAAYLEALRSSRGADEYQCRGARWGVETMAEEAARLYPLPKVERPRVVVDHWGIQWRCVDGAISAADDGKWVLAISGHSTTTYYCVNTERVRIWSDLLANPTELVEDTA